MEKDEIMGEQVRNEIIARVSYRVVIKMNKEDYDFYKRNDPNLTSALLSALGETGGKLEITQVSGITPELEWTKGHDLDKE